MTNTELTLDQLQTISGAMPTAVEYAVHLKTDKAELDKSSTKKDFSFGLTQPHYYQY